MFYVLIAAYIIVVTILVTVKTDIGTKILFIFLISVVLFLTLPLTCDEVKIVKSVKIYSLHDDKEQSGSFILGSGFINENGYYYYFTKNGDTYYKDEVSDKTGIIETDETPKLVTITVYPNIWYGKCFKIRKSHKLYVPKGTIIKEFKVR
jgi:hypothetical protein